LAANRYQHGALGFFADGGNVLMGSPFSSLTPMLKKEINKILYKQNIYEIILHG
jgi:hypothetical protein